MKKASEATILSKAIQFMSCQRPEFVTVNKEVPQKKQVGIKLIASSLCNHSELRSFYGNADPGYGYAYPMKPGEPGHEGVGIVISKGEAVLDIDIGDTVVMAGHGGDECHQSYVLKDSTSVAKIYPGDRNPAHASILEMFACAHHCIRVLWNYGGYENKKVAIIGLGAIGLCSLMLLKLLPVKSITTIDICEDKLKLAQQLKADHIYCILPDSSSADVKKVLGEFDVVIECSGSASGQLLAYELACTSLIFASYCPTPVLVKQSDLFNKNTTIFNPGIMTTDDLKAVANLYNNGLINPSALITKTILPEITEYIQAIEEIRQGKIIKALIDWSAYEAGS